MQLQRDFIVRGAVLLGLANFAMAAQAQSAAPPPVAQDPAFEAAKKSYDALPQPERLAIQDALTWTDDFSGARNGIFGKRTHEALRAYAKRNKLASGDLDDKARAGLLQAAAKAKAALKFAPVPQKSSNIQIALPGKLLTQVTPGPAGIIYAAPDNSARLEIFAPPPADGDLARHFEKLSAGLPPGKTTYKLMKPDFFVIASEVDGRTFYTRFASAKPDGAPPLRGFTFTYATPLQPELARVAIAIANSFEPFGPVGAAAPTPGKPASEAALPAKPIFAATGLALSPTLVLAAVPVNCADVQVGAAKGRMLRHDAGTGMALLETSGLRGQGVAASPAQAGEAVVLYYSRPSDSPAPLQLSAAPGRIGAETPARLHGLMPGQGGGVAFDRAGALLGFVAPAAAAAASYGLIPASAAFAALGQELKAAPAAAPAQTIGQIIGASRATIVAVSCSI